MMLKNYYEFDPAELTHVICELAGRENVTSDIEQDIYDFIYDVEILKSNPLNRRFFMTFWNVLQSIAERARVGEIKEA